MGIRVAESYHRRKALMKQTMTPDSSHSPRPNYSLLILAGGEGRRMGGCDKGLALWQDRPLVEHLIANMTSGYAERLISCNRNLNRYAEYGIAFSDNRTGFQGPLAGIEAGLQRATQGHVLVVPCDCPAPPATLFQRLYQAMATSGNQICFARQGDRNQYLFALLQRECLQSLQNYLATGQRSVRHWYGEQGALAVDFNDSPDGFANYNLPDALTPDVLTKAENK